MAVFGFGASPNWNFVQQEAQNQGLSMGDYTAQNPYGPFTKSMPIGQWSGPTLADLYLQRMGLPAGNPGMLPSVAPPAPNNSTGNFMPNTAIGGTSTQSPVAANPSTPVANTQQTASSLVPQTSQVTPESIPQQMPFSNFQGNQNLSAMAKNLIGNNVYRSGRGFSNPGMDYSSMMDMLMRRYYGNQGSY
jgi:hypothetical protein